MPIVVLHGVETFTFIHFIKDSTAHQRLRICAQSASRTWSKGNKRLVRVLLNDTVRLRQQVLRNSLNKENKNAGNVDGATGASTSVPAVELTGTAANENFGSRGQTLDQAKLEVQESAELKSTRFTFLIWWYDFNDYWFSVRIALRRKPLRNQT